MFHVGDIVEIEQLNQHGQINTDAGVRCIVVEKLKQKVPNWQIPLPQYYLVEVSKLNEVWTRHISRSGMRFYEHEQCLRLVYTDRRNGL